MSVIQRILSKKDPRHPTYNDIRCPHCGKIIITNERKKR